MQKIIHISPRACPRPKVTRFGTYYPKPYQEYNKQLKAQLQDFPQLGEITICFVMKRPKAMKPGEREPHTKKPDLDNLVKGLCDGFPWDDKNIHSLRAFKVYAATGENPCIVISGK